MNSRRRRVRVVADKALCSLKGGERRCTDGSDSCRLRRISRGNRIAQYLLVKFIQLSCERTVIRHPHSSAFKACLPGHFSYSLSAFVVEIFPLNPYQRNQQPRRSSRDGLPEQPDTVEQGDTGFGQIGVSTKRPVSVLRLRRPNQNIDPSPTSGTGS